MPTATLRPNSIDGSANLQWSDTAGNTPVAANISYVADSVDLSEVMRSAFGTTTYLLMGMGTVAMGTGGITRTLTTRARVRSVDTNGVVVNGSVQIVSSGSVLATQATTTNTASSWTTLTSSAFGIGLNQTQLDAIQLQANWDIANNNITYSDLYLDVVYANPPTASVTAPSGVIATRSPTITWLFTQGTDGVGLQTSYRVRIFNNAQYSAGGFDPATSTSTYDSGTVVTGTTSHAVATPLPNNDSYKAYVLVAQTTSGINQPAVAYAASAVFSMNIIVAATASDSWALSATAAAVPEVLATEAGAWGAMAGAVVATPHPSIAAVPTGAWGAMTAAATVTPGALPSATKWMDAYIEILVKIDDPQALVMEKIIVERNHLGPYFDGSTVRGGWLIGPPTVSDYRWDGVPNASRSLYADEYERTNGIVDALLFDAFPINEAVKYAIISYNGVHGVTDAGGAEGARWGRSKWDQGRWV